MVGLDDGRTRSVATLDGIGKAILDTRVDLELADP